MSERFQVYKCEDHLVEVLHPSDCQLVCCDKPMQLLQEQAADATKEKHVPVVTKTPQGVKVVVGSTPHPMQDKHYIEWIEIRFGNTQMRQYLKPGDAPEAFFAGVAADRVTAREYCNVHGLWKA